MNNQNFADLEHNVDFKNVWTDENLCLKPGCMFHIHQSNLAAPRRSIKGSCNLYKNYLSNPCGIPVFQYLAPCDVLTGNKDSTAYKRDLQPHRKENQHCASKKSQENTIHCSHTQHTKNSQPNFEFFAQSNNRQELESNNKNTQTQSKDVHNTGNKGNCTSNNRITNEEAFEKSTCGNAESSSTECTHTNVLSMILAEKLVSNKTSVVHIKCNNCETSSKGVMIFIPIEGDLFNCSHKKYCKSLCSSKTSIVEEKSVTGEKDLSGKYEDTSLMIEKQLHISKVFVQKHLRRDQVYTLCKYCESFSQGILIFLPSPTDMFSKENLNNNDTLDKQQNNIQQEDVSGYRNKVNLLSKVFVQTFVDNRANQIYVQCKVCENISKGIFIFLSSKIDYFDINKINCSKNNHTLLKRSDDCNSFKENFVSNQEAEYSLKQAEWHHKYENCKKCGIENKMKLKHEHLVQPRYSGVEISDNECVLEAKNENQVIRGKTNKHNERIKQSVASFILNSIHPGKSNSQDSIKKNVCYMDDIIQLIPFYCSKCKKTDNDVSNQSCAESVSDNSQSI